MIAASPGLAVDPALSGLDELTRIAGHRSHRRFLPRPVAPDLLKLLLACALSAPSKSDLQQCDIVAVTDNVVRKGIVDTIPDMPWIMDAPVFLVFAANGARLPALAKLRGKPFPNDHLDQFFNAAVDAGIVMTNFIRAASAVGLGLMDKSDESIRSPRAGPSSRSAPSPRAGTSMGAPSWAC